MNYNPTTTDIALTFAARQTPASQFSHWEISTEELIERTVRNFQKWEQSYREGVISVPVEPQGFFSGLVTLLPGMLLVGQYEARKEGEEPRKSTFAVGGQKVPAKAVNVILYNHAVLAEKNEQSSEAEWEIISVNASPTEGETPIPPGALIANHLELSGGTATNMTDAEFVAALRNSLAFWKDKALACPQDVLERAAGDLHDRTGWGKL
jgi:hypothetical protein